MHLWPPVQQVDVVDPSEPSPPHCKINVLVRCILSLKHDKVSATASTRYVRDTRSRPFEEHTTNTRSTYSTRTHKVEVRSSGWGDDFTQSDAADRNFHLFVWFYQGSRTLFMRRTIVRKVCERRTGGRVSKEQEQQQSGDNKESCEV